MVDKTIYKVDKTKNKAVIALFFRISSVFILQTILPLENTGTMPIAVGKTARKVLGIVETYSIGYLRNVAIGHIFQKQSFGNCQTIIPDKLTSTQSHLSI